MKIPGIFVLGNEQKLEEKTEELLNPPEKSVVFNNYKRIEYFVKNFSYILDYYEHHKGGYKWVLSEKEAWEVKWWTCSELDEKAKEILRGILRPVAEVLNLNERDYSLERYDVKKLLDRFAVKTSQKKASVEDEVHGSGWATFYKKDHISIELREFKEAGKVLTPLDLLN